MSQVHGDDIARELAQEDHVNAPSLFNSMVCVLFAHLQQLSREAVRDGYGVSFCAVAWTLDGQQQEAVFAQCYPGAQAIAKLHLACALVGRDRGAATTNALGLNLLANMGTRVRSQGVLFPPDVSAPDEAKLAATKDALAQCVQTMTDLYTGTDGAPIGWWVALDLPREFQIPLPELFEDQNTHHDLIIIGRQIASHHYPAYVQIYEALLRGEAVVVQHV